MGAEEPTSNVEEWMQNLFVPVDPTKPSVNVMYVDLLHAKYRGVRTIPVLPDNVLAGRFKPATAYKANINCKIDACNIKSIPMMIEANQTAPFTLVHLDEAFTPEEIAALENDLTQKDYATHVFFAANKNAFTKKKRPVVTEKIPTVTYDALLKMKALTWSEISKNRVQPRKNFWLDAMESLGEAYKYSGHYGVM